MIIEKLYQFQYKKELTEDEQAKGLLAGLQICRCCGKARTPIIPEYKYEVEIPISQVPLAVQIMSNRTTPQAPTYDYMTFRNGTAVGLCKDCLDWQIMKHLGMNTEIIEQKIIGESNEP